MSDALTSSPTYRTQEVDLAQITPQFAVTKPVFPSYFGSLSFFQQHCSGATAPAEKPSRVQRIGRFPSGNGLGGVV